MIIRSTLLQVSYDKFICTHHAQSPPVIYAVPFTKIALIILFLDISYFVKSCDTFIQEVGYRL